MKHPVPSRIPWPPLLVLLTIAAGWIAHRYVPLAWPVSFDGSSRSAGVIAIASGLAIVAWAGIVMQRANTTILPHAAATALVSSGPFRFSRNPIYVADCLVLVGLALILGTLWIALLVPVFVGLIHWLAIRPEEHHLEAAFGQAYRDYKRRTRRWL